MRQKLQNSGSRDHLESFFATTLWVGVLPGNSKLANVQSSNTSLVIDRAACAGIRKKPGRLQHVGKLSVLKIKYPEKSVSLNGLYPFSADSAFLSQGNEF